MTIYINGTSGISGVDGSSSTPALQGTDSNTGISFPAADTVAINTGGTERSRVDSSGRLLVGTSTARNNIFSSGGAVTPTLQLENNTNTWSNGLSILNYSGSQYGASMALGMSASNTPGTNALVTSGQLCGRFHFLANDGTNFYPIAEIGGWTDGTTGTGDVPGRLVFSTTADGASSPTERMRIDNRGRVNVGGTGGLNAGFTVDWPANALEPVVINDTSNTAGQTHRISFRTGGTETGKIISGTTLGTSYVTSSDYRLKQGIVDLGDGVGRLAQLKPRRFSFINSPETVIDGFVAHEVQDIVPEAITGEKDAVDDDGNPIYQGIDHSRLVPLLTAALQEAVAEINALKDRVAALEGASPNP